MSISIIFDIPTLRQKYDAMETKLCMSVMVKTYGAISAKQKILQISI